MKQRLWLLVDAGNENVRWVSLNLYTYAEICNQQHSEQNMSLEDILQLAQPERSKGDTEHGRREPQW